MILDVKFYWGLGSKQTENDESFKGQLTDFEKFLSTESKTEENRQKDKDLFLMDLFGIRPKFRIRNFMLNDC